MLHEHWKGLQEPVDELMQEELLKHIKEYCKKNKSLEAQCLNDILNNTSKENILDYYTSFAKEDFKETNLVFKSVNGAPAAMIQYKITNNTLITVGIIVIDKYNNSRFIHNLIKSLNILLVNRYKLDFTYVLKLIKQDLIKEFENIKDFRNASINKKEFALFLCYLDM